MSDIDTVDPVGATDSGRANPTNLEGDLKSVLDDIVLGSIVLEADRQPTPHVLAGLIQQRRGGAESDKPSSGAVASALQRWADVGFINLTSSPTAFVGYTNAGVTEGLAALKKAHRERLSAARAATKAELKTTVTATEPEPAVAAGDAVDTTAPF
jgi:hypothetical protein